MGKPACCDKSSSTGLKKRPWTAEEDQKLLHYISKHGHGRWRTVPNNAGLQRCGKSCRLRWTNYLRPDIKRGRFSVEEEDTIIQLHSVLGNKWSLIASRLPGRTDNEIKNYWNTHIKKRLLRQGIDPVTHNLRLDLLQLCAFHNSSSLNSMFSPQLNYYIQSLLDIQNVMNTIPNLQNYPEFMGMHHNRFIHFPRVQPIFPASTSSNISLLNTTLLVQGNMEQVSSPSFNFSSRNYYVPSLCQNINGGNDQSTYLGHESVVSPSANELNRSLVQLVGADENQMFQFNNINNAKNFEFGSVISTPSFSGHDPFELILHNNTC